MKRILSLVLIISILLGCQPRQDPLSQKEFCLDTVVRITLYDSDSKNILNKCFDLCRKYELIFSNTNTSSELYKVNHDPLKTSYQPISKDLAHIIEQGLYYSQLSKGAFDITIGSISSLWDFKSNHPSLPDASLIKKNLSNVSYTNVICHDQKILYKNKETMIDLGAIAKGYIADQIKSYLLKKHISSALINLGGNILCVGNKNGNPFTIGITDPKKTNSSIIRIEAQDQSIVTSGIYQRNMTINKHFYHHILDPHTGYSYNNDLASVTILSPTSTQGDALSTVCFSLGLDEGLKLIDSMKGIEACFIDKNNHITYSKNFKHL